MNLGSYFPERYREAFAGRNIEIGSVIKLFVKDTHPPKEKRFIVVGFSEDRLILATVFINTEINKNVNWCQELRLQNLLFETDGRDYLEHPSYIDCSKLVPKDYYEIESAVKERPEAILGKVCPEDWQLIKDTILHSTTIKGKHKKKFGFYDNS